MSELNNLFSPKSIAIVGASEEAGKVGNVIAKNILELGYQGKVFLVNPKHETLFGQKCYAKVAEIGQEIDLVIAAIPAKYVSQTIKEASDRAKNFIVISAGFAEIGMDGRLREKQLLEVANEGGLRILGPNCLGFINPLLKLNASFAGGLPSEGNIAFVSQSGALAVALMDIAKKEGLGFSKIISIGNKMQLGEADIAAYLADDDQTNVVAMYLEGIKDGRNFIEVAKKIAGKKPVVILKAGRSAKSQKAIASHTGALAGSDEITDAVFAKTGCVRANDIEQFLGLIKLFSFCGKIANEEAIVVTNAGGLGVLTTDAFHGRFVRLAEISDAGRKELRHLLPEESSLANPVDVLGDADAERYEKTLKTLGKEMAGTIICLLTPQDQTPVDEISEKIIDFKNSSGKNIVTVFMGGGRVAVAEETLSSNQIPNFFIADQAVSALDKFCRWQKRISFTASEMKLDKKRKEQAEAIIKRAKSVGRTALTFAEASVIANLYGIRSIESHPVRAQHGFDYKGKFPVVLKVDSDKVLHKTDKHGVILDIKNREELADAFHTIKKNFPGADAVVQPMLERKYELIFGIKRDEVFGPIIVYGLGGIYTEIFRLAEFLVPPLAADEVRNSLEKGKLGFLFRETRGQKPCNMAEISQIILGLAEMVGELPNIRELDINPLLVYNDGKPATAVDIKMII